MTSIWPWHWRLWRLSQIGSVKVSATHSFATLSTNAGGWIECPFPVPSEAFMVLELSPGAAAGRRGTVRYRPEFELI
jgi:hypothetical protein